MYEDISIVHIKNLTMDCNWKIRAFGMSPLSGAQPGLSKVASCWQKFPPTNLVSIGWLLCLAFLYGWCFLNKISLDWRLTLTTQPSTSKLSDNPAHHFQDLLKVRNFRRYFQGVVTFRDHNFRGLPTMETLW